MDLKRKQDAMRARQAKRLRLPDEDQAGIYLIGNEAFGWYKVGKTTHLHTRHGEIDKGIPFTVEILSFVPVSNDKLGAVEYAVLKTLGKDRYVKNDWFVGISAIEFQQLVVAAEQRTKPRSIDKKVREASAPQGSQNPAAAKCRPVRFRSS